MCSPSWSLLPPPSPSHPSGSFQCISPKHPVSHIEPGLVIYFTYDNTHVSMPFSQIIPQSSKDSSIPLCLFCCLAYRVIITIFLLFDHLYFLLFCLHLYLLLLLHLCVSEDTAYTTASLRICAQVHYKGDSLVIFESGSPKIKLLVIYLED